MKINPHIFRAYDIRGIVPTDLSPAVAQRIGWAYATYLAEHNPGKSLHVVVGRDNRPHGAELSIAFQQGIRTAGVEVFDLGLSPSPFLYYTVTTGHFDGGVNITASHNPAEYNGFKLVAESALSICGDEIQKIFALTSQAPENFSSEEPTPLTENYETKYSQDLSSKITLSRPLKVVVDSAGGVSTGLYSRILTTCGATAIELYPQPDGSFPYHSPDPLVESNLADLKARVLAESADLGLAFDGDGDRVLAITEKGEFVDANQLLVLLARHLVKPEQTVVHTVSSSSIVPEEVLRLKAKPVMVPVGHSFVEEKMRETGAILGGEQSGHFFIHKNYYSYDDALYTALNLLDFLASSSQPFSQIIQTIPTRFSTPERRLTCPEEEKFELVKKLTTHFQKKYPVETMDGARIDFGEGGWAGIRASNTSPCLSVITEAPTSSLLAKINSEVDLALRQFPQIEL